MVVPGTKPVENPCCRSSGCIKAHQGAAVLRRNRRLMVRSPAPSVSILKCICINVLTHLLDLIKAGACTIKQVNIPRISFRDPAELNLTIAVRLSGHMKLFINSISQPRFSSSGSEVVHIKEACLLQMTNHRHRQVWLTAEQHTSQQG